MPFKVPFTPIVVTGHRGNELAARQDMPVVKALSGQPNADSLVALKPASRPPSLVQTYGVPGPGGT